MLLTSLLVCAALAGAGLEEDDAPSDDAPSDDDDTSGTARETRSGFDRGLSYGGARLSHNQVILWDVSATGTNAAGESLDPLDTSYIAYEIGGLLRGSVGVHGALAFGADVSLSFVPGILLGPGPPFGVGGSLTGHVALGNDGTNVSPSPVGLVVGGGVRGDALWLTGLSTSNGREPIVVGASPVAFSEAIVSVAGLIFGLRGEYRHRVRWRREGTSGSTDLRVTRYGGGLVFGGAF